MIACGVIYSYSVIQDLVQNFKTFSRPNRHFSKEQGVFGLATRQGDGRMYTGQWVKNRMHGTGHPGRFGVNKEGRMNGHHLLHKTIQKRRFLACSKLKTPDT